MNEQEIRENIYQNGLPERPDTLQNSVGLRALPRDVIQIFAQLAPQQVEQFYKSYQFWQLQQQIINRKLRTTTLEQQIADNTVQMQQTAPSELALSILAHFQANGVNDIDLLDRMLERGDVWLDHTQQLLERCEQLDVIQDDYAQWCENALEGAYDWITSMDSAGSPSPDDDIPDTDNGELAPATEAELLQMLTHDEDATERAAALHQPKITVPLPEIEYPEIEILTMPEQPSDTELAADPEITPITTLEPPPTSVTIDDEPLPIGKVTDSELLPTSEETDDELTRHMPIEELIQEQLLYSANDEDDEQALPPIIVPPTPITEITPVTALPQHPRLEEHDSEEIARDRTAPIRPIINWSDTSLSSTQETSPTEAVAPKHRGFFAWLTAFWKK